MAINASQIARKTVVVFTATMLLLFVCGCSSYNREWKRVAKFPSPANSMEGRWEGHWLSDANGHNGKLLCIVSRQESGEYAAWFKATYQKVLKFSYTVPLTVETRDGGWQFRGEEDLGKLAGGVYQYEGTATATNFHSTYRSKYDHGVFEMIRPANP